MKELSYIWLLLISQTILAQSSFSFEAPQMESYFADKSNVPIIRGRFLHFAPEDWDSLSIVYVLHHFSLKQRERHPHLVSSIQYLDVEALKKKL